MKYSKEKGLKHTFYFYWLVINMFCVGSYLICEFFILLLKIEFSSIEVRFLIVNSFIFISLMILASYLYRLVLEDIEFLEEIKEYEEKRKEKEAN